MSLQSLNKIDRIMWDADTPSYPNSICSMMVFEEELSNEKVISVLQDRLLRFERFRQTIITKKETPHWGHIQDFDVKNHVQFKTIDSKSNDELFLQNEINKLMSSPLNYEAPLWDAIVFQGYKGGAAMVFRLHHVIADGAALINVFFSLTGSTSKESLLKQGDKSHFLIADLPIVKGVQKFIRNSSKVIDEAKNVWNNPEIIKENLMKGVDIAKDAMSFFTHKEVSGEMYKGTFGEEKKAAWLGDIDLTVIKTIGKQYGATVNDVLLALMAGAVRRHLQKHKQPVDCSMRIVIPVNIRDEHDAIKLHNEIGMISLDLPVHLTTFLRRLHFINEKTTMLKNSPEPFLLSKFMESVADYLPKNAKDKVIDFLATKLSAAITNVPGPREKVYFAGLKVQDIYCWIPHSAPLGVGLSMLSYNNKVSLGMVIDKNMADDPEYVLKAFKKELHIAQKHLK